MVIRIEMWLFIIACFLPLVGCSGSASTNVVPVSEDQSVYEAEEKKMEEQIEQVAGGV
jgi:hypothetical protein